MQCNAPRLLSPSPSLSFTMDRRPVAPCTWPSKTRRDRSKCPVGSGRGAIQPDRQWLSLSIGLRCAGPKLVACLPAHRPSYRNLLCSPLCPSQSPCGYCQRLSLPLRHVRCDSPRGQIACRRAPSAAVAALVLLLVLAAAVLLFSIRAAWRGAPCWRGNTAVVC